MKAKKLPPRPDIRIYNYSVAFIFFHAKEVPRQARHLLAFASNVRCHGGNLYKMMDSHSIAKELAMSYGVFMRSKKALKDAGLLFYDGTFGDLSHLKERWEQATGEKWEYEI